MILTNYDDLDLLSYFEVPSAGSSGSFRDKDENVKKCFSDPNFVNNVRAPQIPRRHNPEK